MSKYEEIIVYKRAMDSKSTAYFPARPKLLTSGQTDRQTRCLKGDHSQKVMQRVEVQSQRKKKNEKRDNKQCLLDTPHRVTVNNKRLISKCKKPEKKHTYTKAIALLRITKGNKSFSIGP